MLKKFLLALSLSLPLAAISVAAYAGTTISDKRYWPNEVGPGAYTMRVFHGEPSSAFASTPGTQRFQIAPKSREGGKVWRYQGGPQSR
jgi:hypothetical protein